MSILYLTCMTRAWYLLFDCRQNWLLDVLKIYEDVISDKRNSSGIGVILDFKDEFYLTDEIFIEFCLWFSVTSNQ